MIKITIWLAILYSCLQSKHCLATGEKHALLIGVSKYPRESGWAELHAFRDVELMKQTLLKQGFKEQNIIAIEDKLANRSGIIENLKELVGKLKEGDHAVIFYSGHGQQIYDDNGDELDNLDEALAPYGAPMKVSYDQYKGDKHIRDDELGEWIERLRIKVKSAGHVLVILDSCSSGTATKGAELISRGGPPIIPQGKEIPLSKSNDVIGFNDVQQYAVDRSKGSFVLFSGATANQTNFETLNELGQPVGPLSHAVFRAFNQISSDATYRALFAQVRNRMAVTSPYQTPTLEGDADKQVFDKGVIVQQAYYEIDKIETEMVLLRAGALTGAAKGAQIGFYKSGTTVPNQQNWLASGEVIEAGPFSSKVVLSQGNLPGRAATAWAFVVRQSFNDWSVKIAIDDNVPSDIKQILIENLQQHAILQVVPTNNAHLRIKSARAPLQLKLVNSADSIMMKPIEGATSEFVVKNAVDQIKGYAIGQFLKEIDIPKNSRYKVVLSVSSVDPKSGQQSMMGPGNVPQVMIGKPAWITIRNEGDETFFYNLLDFQPDGLINITVPKKELYEPSELRLVKGESKTFKVNISKPIGMETNRVFVGAQPFDLRLAFGFFSAKGPTSPIEELLHSALGRTKGAEDLAFDPSSGGVATCSFEIVEKR